MINIISMYWFIWTSQLSNLLPSTIALVIVSSIPTSIILDSSMVGHFSTVAIGVFDDFQLTVLYVAISKKIWA